ncbi:hypothetical protein SteCoe_17332 [Stentor coeruleus]|uniref:Uncharacterized protein n=1 Tax=Stentor coeruleus TaxID=5963 RepID=A0A1R2BZB2_9CILI|nr:hypothetical protein SteCoe_17332 [Stentor coeruleus]
MFLSTSINSMVYEWLKIVVLSKSILFVDKRNLIRKGFYVVIIVTLFLWMSFVASIFVAIWTQVKFVELMASLYIISSLVNFLLVSYIGLKLIKAYALFLESSKYALSRWVYLGIVISLIKMSVPGIFMFDTKIKKFFDYESFSLAFTLINHNFGGILPMLVYHKSFKLSFIILDENRRSQNLIKSHLKNIAMIESANSLESLSEDYAMQ